ncbi:MAG TPA: DUF4340 domain-containing protein [bacterium]|nr:DUF4340 domain-containing protein [bacterium]
MRRSFLKAAVLPSIAVLLGAYYLLFERPEPKATQAPPPSLLIFPGLSPEHISRIELRTPDVTLDAVKREGKWVLRSPQKAPASQAEIERLISILTSAEYTRKARFDQIGGDLAQFGLTSPSLIISVRSDEPSRQERPARMIRFGHLSPSGAVVYAIAAQGQELLLIDADVVNRLKYFLFVPPLGRGARS